MDQERYDLIITSLMTVILHQDTLNHRLADTLDTLKALLLTTDTRLARLETDTTLPFFQEQSPASDDRP